MASYIDIPQRTWSNYKSVKNDVPVRVILKLEELGYSMNWIIKGDGNHNSPRPKNSKEITLSIERSKLENVENFGNINMILTEKNETEQKADKPVFVFRIPLLSKEEVLHFDPVKEIPDPKAHSEDYPDTTLVAIPMRFREYSTDLRAMLVFNSLMSPLFNAGDMIIFQATGWNGNGVYVYRVNGELHISHVRFDGKQYLLSKESKPEEEIPCPAESFEPIGRIRAVLKEVP
jgi:hypothetical protein